MSGSEFDPLERYAQSAKSWRDNHVELGQDNLAWLGRTGTEADNVIQVQRIQDQQPNLYVDLWDVVSDETSRKVLRAIAMNDGAGYEELREWLPRASRRTLERRVSDLRSRGIIEGGGKPVTFHFATPASKLLTEHVLSIVDKSELTTKQ